MIEIVTADGRWTSDDGGISWLLIEPSQAWLASRRWLDEPPDVPPEPDPQSP